MYLTNASKPGRLTRRDRPVSGERRYFGRFFAFFFGFWMRGSGGDASILRNTSSALGCGVALRSCFMVMGD